MSAEPEEITPKLQELIDRCPPEMVPWLRELVEEFGESYGEYADAFEVDSFMEWVGRTFCEAKDEQ